MFWKCGYSVFFFLSDMLMHFQLIHEWQLLFWIWKCQCRFSNIYTEFIIRPFIKLPNFQVAVRNIRRDGIKAYQKLEKVLISSNSSFCLVFPLIFEGFLWYDPSLYLQEKKFSEDIVRDLTNDLQVGLILSACFCHPLIMALLDF